MIFRRFVVIKFWDGSVLYKTQYELSSDFSIFVCERSFLCNQELYIAIWDNWELRSFFLYIRQKRQVKSILVSVIEVFVYVVQT